MKVEVARPGLSVPNSPYGLCGCKTALNLNCISLHTQLCESRGGRPRLPVPNSPYGFCGHKATSEEEVHVLRSCVKVEVAVLGSPVPNSPYGLCGCKTALNLNCISLHTQLCESRGGRPRLPVPNSPYCFCGHKATSEEEVHVLRSCVKVEVAVLGSLSLIVLMVLCGCKTALNLNCISPAYTAM